MTDTRQTLAKRALSLRACAYAPYSGFHVGAALLCADGSIYDGCNIENAAYTPTNCAERTAFFAAVRDGKRSFTAIAIAGGRHDAALPLLPCAPCGVCLQVMMEFCDPVQFAVYLVEDDRTVREYRLSELLPVGFGPGSL